MHELEEARQTPRRESPPRPTRSSAVRDFASERVKAETEPTRVYRREREWVVDYGSYAHGYYPTRSEAVKAGEAGARRERRGLSISAAQDEETWQSSR
jgi:hypothetical protein